MSWLVSILSLLAPGSFAADLRFGASVVELGQHERTTELALENHGSSEAHVQIRAYAWEEGQDGHMILEPTPDVVVSPSRFVLSAGQRGMLRVTAAVIGAKEERSYRIVVEDATPLPSDVPVAVPVFVAPRAPTARAGIANGRVGGQAVALDVVNDGNAHVRLQEVDVVGRDASGAMVFAASARGGYVLAGGTRSFNIGYPAEKCSRIARFDVSAPSDQGTVTASLPAEPLACLE